MQMIFGCFSFCAGHASDVYGCMTQSHDGFTFEDEHFRVNVGQKEQFAHNTDDTLCLAFYGELTHRQAIISRLDATEKSNDAQIALLCYQKFGDTFTEILDGAFTLAVYDENKNRILLARDKVGVKSLYYCVTKQCIVFSSQLNLIADIGVVKKSINKTALAQYFQLTYIPAPLTMYQGIFKLPAASCLIVNNNGETKVQRYWDVPLSQPNIIDDYAACKKQLSNTLYAAVGERMNAGGRVGTLISGGIDSTIITGIMSRLSDQPIHAFTIAFNQKEYDESDKARIAAKKFGCDHHVHLLTHEELMSNLDIMLDNLDEPYADSSYVAAYSGLKMAHEYVDFVLTGDGGDELFAGYEKYLVGYYADIYNKIPKAIRQGLIAPIMSIIPDNTNLTRKIHKVMRNAEKDVFEQRRSLMCLGFGEGEIGNLLSGNAKLPDSLTMIHETYTKLAGISDEITQAQYTDFKIVLEGDMLPKVEYAGRLSGTFTRAPMLDADTIDLAYRIPSKHKIHGRNLKYILKDTFSELIPPELLNATKHGFGVPIDDWFRNALKLPFEACMDETFLREQGLFDGEVIRRMYQEHLSMKHNRFSELWAFFVFQRWYKRNIL